MTIYNDFFFFSLIFAVWIEDLKQKYANLRHLLFFKLWAPIGINAVYLSNWVYGREGDSKFLSLYQKLSLTDFSPTRALKSTLQC